MEAGFNWLHHIPAEQAALFLLDVCDITLVCGRMFDVHRRHANLPAFGGILPLFGRIPAIPHRINEIPLFKTILCVTESSKIAHLLSPNGLFQAQNVPKHVVSQGSAPGPHSGSLQCSP